MRKLGSSPLHCLMTIEFKCEIIILDMFVILMSSTFNVMVFGLKMIDDN